MMHCLHMIGRLVTFGTFWIPGQIMLGQLMGWDKLSENFDLTGYALKEDVPEKISDLENDSGFITEEQVETDYVKTSAFEKLVQRVEVLEGSGT